MKRRKAQSALSLLRERVKRNVIRGKGITNETVYRYCRMSCSSMFQGVFASDDIPKQIAIRTKFILIVNLAPKKVQNPTTQGHFVTICAGPAEIYYLDSYGLPCVEKNVEKFLKLCNRPIKFNSRPIQHMQSSFCALYAILFSIYFDKGAPFKLTFRTNALRTNDQLCKKYIERLIRMK